MHNFHLYFILALTILGTAVLYLDYKRRLKYKSDVPPAVPTETPTIVRENVEYGSHNYALKHAPEETVSVVDVSDGMVIFMDSQFRMMSLQISEFMLSYEKRVCGSISRK